MLSGAITNSESAIGNAMRSTSGAKSCRLTAVSSARAKMARGIVMCRRIVGPSSRRRDGCGLSLTEKAPARGSGGGGSGLVPGCGWRSVIDGDRGGYLPDLDQSAAFAFNAEAYSGVHGCRGVLGDH